MGGSLFRAPLLENAIELANRDARSSARVADELDLLVALAGQSEAVAGRAAHVAGLRAGRLGRPSPVVDGLRSVDAVMRAAEEFAAADGSMMVATEHVLCVLLVPGSASWSQSKSTGVEPRLVRSQAATEASEVERPIETAEIRERAAGAAVAWRDVPPMASDKAARSFSASAAETICRGEAVLGAAVVTVSGGTEDIAVRGFADAGLLTPLSANSQFRIGSLTKILTAIAALAFVERARVDLDTPVSSYLAHLRIEPAPGPTLRQLLVHVGGAPSGAWLHRPGEIAPAFLEAVDGVVTLTSPPGNRWDYSNIGYAVVGQVLEDTAGASFATVVRDTVLAPLGMESTTVAPTPVADLPDGYWVDRGDLVATPKRDIIMRAAGGAVSTPTDIARLLTFIANPSASSSAPISEESIAAMLRTQAAHAGPAAANHGIALRLRESDGRVVGWHPGRISGFPSAICVTAGAGSAVMLNTESLSVAAVALASLMRAHATDGDP